MLFASLLVLPADTNSSPSPAEPASTNAAPVKHGMTITTKPDDDDDTSTNPGDKNRTETINIGGSHEGDWNMTAMTALMIPIIGTIATFGTVVLIVFFVCYFKYRRRQESLATVREYLNKGLPVPPELLADSGSRVDAAASTASSAPASGYGQSDIRRGFKWAFIGLGVTLALFVNDRHSTDWGWGLIPLVIGVGYLLSGWMQERSATRNPPYYSPPPENPPKP
jgi:hypothetical protein